MGPLSSPEDRPSVGRVPRETFALRAHSSTGYYILDQPAGRLIADYGAPGASYNPGHQHAGIFSYEISSEAGRIVVDTGTPTYEPGQERQLARGTSAHNTVRVDREDQFVLWKAFRVGRRAFVHDVETRSGHGWHSITGRHDGYRPLGVAHRRTIVGLEGAGWLVVDRLAGQGSHFIENFVHLHPGVEPESSGRITRLTPFDWTLAALRMPSFEMKSGRCSTRLGERLPCKRLIACGQADLPCCWAYWVAPFPPDQLAWEASGGATLALSAGGRTLQVNLLKPGPIESTLEI